jgi:hypothetical protein
MKFIKEKYKEPLWQKIWADNNQNKEHIYEMVEPILELPLGFEPETT